ncbi:hypothetical protein AMTR_s00018p00243790 [Amborella trichopoda]|uniref:Transmembrane protein n=1 Tax=Amborella trichopoda TaxID=13333 RepID=W1PKR8_AMBTC|nr:hypothetical protein AMTR_s00018p00243790 [Amborella trichopoda]
MVQEQCTYAQKPSLVEVVVAWTFLFVVFVIGGVVMAWWVIKCDPSESDLWMVPIGLVLLGTPTMLCVSFLGSERNGSTGAVFPLKLGSCGSDPSIMDLEG